MFCAQRVPLQTVESANMMTPTDATIVMTATIALTRTRALVSG